MQSAADARLMLVAGDNDNFHPMPSTTAPSTWRRAPRHVDGQRARREFWLDTGHSIHSERPHLFVREILYFLDHPDAGDSPNGTVVSTPPKADYSRVDAMSTVDRKAQRHDRPADMRLRCTSAPAPATSPERADGRRSRCHAVPGDPLPCPVILAHDPFPKSGDLFPDKALYSRGDRLEDRQPGGRGRLGTTTSSRCRARWPTSVQSPARRR